MPPRVRDPPADVHSHDHRDSRAGSDRRPPIPGRCNAERTKDGVLLGYCKLRPIEGAKRCMRHGSGTRAARAAAKKVVQTTKARAAVAAFGIVREDQLERVDPVVELQRQAARLQGEGQWLDDPVAGLDSSDHTQTTPLGVGLGVWVKLHQEAHDRLNTLLVKMQQLGLWELEVQFGAARRDQVLALCMWMAAQLAPERTEPELLQLVAQGVRKLGSAKGRAPIDDDR